METKNAALSKDAMFTLACSSRCTSVPGCLAERACLVAFVVSQVWPKWSTRLSYVLATPVQGTACNGTVDHNAGFSELSARFLARESIYLDT